LWSFRSSGNPSQSGESTLAEETDLAPDPPDKQAAGLAALRTREEQVRRVAGALRRAVVAVKNPSEAAQPRPKRHEQGASGVIITVEGLVLSQYHVSHQKSRQVERGTPESYKPGEKTKVILHDGREVEAELLGANQVHDLSLLRLLSPGPYPHVELKRDVSVAIGDWVLQLGHVQGYRRDRAAPLRLGRVVARTDEAYCLDCLTAGGDSGSPVFDLKGNLVGIMRTGPVPFLVDLLPVDGDLAQRCEPWAATASRVVSGVLDKMRREISAADVDQKSLVVRKLLNLQPGKDPRLPGDFWANGRQTLAGWRALTDPVRASTVVVLNRGAPVALGTVVGADGWVITKASELPAEPRCRLAGGRVERAQVPGIDRAFDLALLKVAASGLQPVVWAESFSPAAGTLIAAIGPRAFPLAAGVVSVPRRDLADAAPPKYSLPLRVAAARVELLMLESANPNPKGGYQVTQSMGRAFAAGIRAGDILKTVNGNPVRNFREMRDCVKGHLSGDRVKLELSRAGKPLTIEFPLHAGGMHMINFRMISNFREDDFPTVFEHALPVLPHECGGPLIDLSGKVVGITIARVGAHGCMAVPGDCVQRLLPELKAGKKLAGWNGPKP
jgi:serine protease Do